MGGRRRERSEAAGALYRTEGVSGPGPLPPRREPTAAGTV